MCRRYALPEPLAVEREFLPAQSWWKFDVRSNVAPGQYVPAIRLHDGTAEGVMMRWGLIPSWAEGKAIEAPTECADMEALERSEVFRMPWLSSQRCILPMAGFYVWHLTEQQFRQPYFVRLRDRGVFGVAALWDRSVRDKDDVIESCSIVRVEANSLLADLAGRTEFMPGILRRRDYDLWLRGTPSQARAALGTYRSDWMQAHPVSPRVNSLQYDDPDLCAPV
jgi:putative SOS response-associated peptidase YedK